MESSKIYFFVGTTAELIKISPVLRELKKRKKDFKIISSNQNELRFSELKLLLGKELSDYTFKMSINPWIKDIYLRFIVWILKSISNFFLYFYSEFQGVRKNVYFIVHGDTVTALIGALVAKLNRVKLVHIESGLRSFNFLEPFPEEISRFVISHLADIHFCPNNWAAKNLKSTGGVKINTFQNTIIESTGMVSKKVKRPKFLGKKKYFVLVLHRQEHTLFNRSTTEKLIEKIVGRSSNKLNCVFIMHKLTRDFLKKQKILRELEKNTYVILPDRLSYPEFVGLLKYSEFIATDGGSNQEEAYYLGKPCLILRNCTERIEGLGENAILSKNNLEVIEDFITNYKIYKRKKPSTQKKPSKIIIDYLMHK